jgi:hypothetical protein
MLLPPLLAVLLCACGQKPTEVARDYLANLKLGRYAECYKMLSRRDQLAQTLEQFAANPPLAPDVNRAWFDAVEGATDYVLDEKVRGHGLQVSVAVNVTTVDLPLWERAIVSAFGPVAAPRAARESLRQGNYPRVSYDDELVMVKEFHRWRIFADLAAYERIGRLHREALRRYHEHQFDQAELAYRALFDALREPRASGAPGKIFRYSRELDLILAAKKRAGDGRLYSPKLKLAKVVRQMTSTGDPGMFAEIINIGDKPVDDVRVTVSYYVIQDGKRSLVLATDYSAITNPLQFTGFLVPPAPLMPGERRTFGLRLNVAVGVQEEATPRLTVASVIFPPYSAQALKAALSHAVPRQ